MQVKEDHVLFCLSCKHNSPLLKRKSTLLNKWMKIKRIKISRIKVVKCVGAKAQDENIHWNTSKTNNCTVQNAQLLTWSLFTQEIFQGQDQNRPLANLPVVNFLSQPQEMLLPKPLNTQLSVFCCAFWFFPLLGKFLESFFPSKNVTVNNADFYSVLAAIMRKNSHKWPWI